jgi:hypothetical protein
MDVLSEIKSADDAFLSASVPKTLNGVELLHYSLMRQAAALEITGLNVETAFMEAVIRIWLCTLEHKAVFAAMRDKAKAMEDAFAWASKQGFSFENWAPLRDLYKRINDEIRQSTNVRADGDTEETPKKTGEQPVS